MAFSCTTVIIKQEMLIYIAAPFIQIYIFVNGLDIVETEEKNLTRVGPPNFDFVII